jgi:hypothetical protein
MGAWKVALRLLMERVRRGGKPVTLHSVQVRRFFWPALAGENRVLFEWRAPKLASVGGLSETLPEKTEPALTLMRELREELGLGSILTAEEAQKFALHHEVQTSAGEIIRLDQNGWIQFGKVYRLRADPRGPILAKLPFGLRVSCTSFDAYVYADPPTGVEAIPGALPFGATGAWRVPGAEELTSLIAAPLEGDDAVFAGTTERDWRMPSEYYIATRPKVADYYYAQLRRHGARPPLPPDPEGRYFNADGTFTPFGSVAWRLVTASAFLAI